MAARIVQSVSIHTGCRPGEDGEKDEYTEAGVVIEYDTHAGGAFRKISVPASMLNPVLAGCALNAQKRKDPKLAGSGNVFLLLRDIRGRSDNSAPRAQPAAPAAATPQDGEDDIPF